MNLAFSALLLLLLLLPGFVLLFCYSRGFWTWTSPVSFQRVTDQLALSLVLACVLHLMWAGAAWWLFGIRVDVRPLIMVLLNSYGPDDAGFAATMGAIVAGLPAAAAYLLLLCAAAALLGLLGHWAVRRTRLDRRTRLLRFNNEWYYLLSGEILQFGELDERPYAIDGVYLSAVVQHQEHDYLYRGVVRDFSYDSSGQLDRVVLAAAHRRLLASDRREGESRPSDYRLDPRYYAIEGDYFVLRYADMKTLNVEYFALETPAEVASAASAEPPTADAPPSEPKTIRD